MGGIANGLSGAGLVLQDNGGDDLSLTSSGNFTFATRLASGASYNVSIRTQPSNPTQTCVLSNPSGTIGSANVTNVSVTCTTNAYTLGGTVYGVSADAGLVLQNGSEELAVSRNGSFIFATNVSSGTLYTVAVKTQPRAPVQTCTVENASGTMGAAGVADVVVSCDGIALLAGALGGEGFADGVGAAARFNQPADIAIDPAGNLFVADSSNHTIRKITTNGVVSTLAGIAGVSGSADGDGNAALFFTPRGLATDATGNLYVADYNNHIIRKITPAGVVSTLAGVAGLRGSDDGIGTAARFRFPTDIVGDASGNLYVTDTSNHTIRKITPAGVVSTLAGAAGQVGSSNGSGIGARFNSPRGLAVDATGNVYVTDTSNHTIRKITPAGVVTTFAGTAGQAGSTDGSTALFNRPDRMGIDSTGNLIVPDSTNYTIRRVTPAGVVSTLAGTARMNGSVDGTGSAARFQSPSGVAIDSAGNTYVADLGNHTIRKITPAAVVSTFAGTPLQLGTEDGNGRAARFDDPYGIATDAAGNVYVAEISYNTIRKITPEGTVSTLAGDAEQLGGSADGIGSAARFYGPVGLATDSTGNLYVTDYGNSTVRKITPAGVVSTTAGLAGQVGFEDGIGSAARFYAPYGIATDPSDNVYVADQSAIRKITPDGMVNTFAGTWDETGSDNGTGSAARFSLPQGLDTDAAGNVYVADTGNNTIRKITPAGAVSTLAGTAGEEGSDDGIGSAARFNSPTDVVVDAAGNVYVADSNNNAIRRITPDGTVTTVAGTPTLSGVGLGPLPGSLTEPKYIALLPGPKVTLAVTNAEKGILLITLP